VESLEAIKVLYDEDGQMFDVILMDCEMPVMNGYTAVRKLRELEAEGVYKQRNYVIALTGNARAGQVQSARDAGMDEVMIKPYKIDDLLLTMRSHPPIASQDPSVDTIPNRLATAPISTSRSSEPFLPTPLSSDPFIVSPVTPEPTSTELLTASISTIHSIARPRLTRTSSLPPLPPSPPHRDL